MTIAPAPSADGHVADHDGRVVTAEDLRWLVAHLRAAVAAGSTVWAGHGMTLLQLSALHLISAYAPVTVTDLAQALGTRTPATSVMVARLIHAKLVCRAPDPQDHRRVRLTITANAERIVGGTDADTARRLQTVLNSISLQTRSQLIDVLTNTVRRSGRAAHHTTPTSAPPTTRPGPLALRRAARTPPATDPIGAAGP